jgi:hypothetical protein
MEQRYGQVLGEERKVQATEMKFQRAVVTKARRDIIMLQTYSPILGESSIWRKYRNILMKAD